MEDNKFWLSLWKIVAIALCVIVASIASCTSYQTSTIATMVKGGADPVRAGCAVRGEGERGLCLSLIITDSKKQ